MIEKAVDRLLDVLTLLSVIALLATGVYFAIGWHKGGSDEVDGTIDDPDRDANASRSRKIRDRVNRLWGS